MHDIGALSMMSSDSQAMGRLGEVIIRTWQTADKMKKQRGRLPQDKGDNDNALSLIHISRSNRRGRTQWPAHGSDLLIESSW